MSTHSSDVGTRTRFATLEGRRLPQRTPDSTDSAQGVCDACSASLTHPNENIIRLKHLSDQTLVIMGASSGIGLVLAREAARLGAAVFLIARNGSALEQICADITSTGGRAKFAVADVGEQDQVRAAAQEALDQFGGFDTWVNTAGVALYAPLTETPTMAHQRLFQTNYWGVVYGSLAAVAHLKTRGGSLITVGSVVSDIGTPLLGAYAASKHAVKGFVDSLRIELLAERSAVSVTLIKPSGIGTPLAEHAASFVGTATLIPPLVYDPQLVVEAILHAATRPRREIIVGGVGSLQIWGSRILPRLSDRISSWFGPLLVDKTREPPAVHNLYAPAIGGEERSAHQSMLRNSLYTKAVLNPWLIAGLAGLLIGAAVAGVSRRSRSDAD